MELPSDPSVHQLDYAGKSPRVAQTRFRFGRVGLLLSGFNVLAIAGLEVAEYRIRINWQVNNDVLIGLSAVSLISMAMGVAGCLQRGAKLASAIALLTSLLCLLFLPMLAM